MKAKVDQLLSLILQLQIEYKISETPNNTSVIQFGFLWTKASNNINMFKAIILATVLAVARAGYLGAPAVATYAAAAPVAHYSAAPAVSSSYFHQAHAPALAAVHAAPLAAVHAAPAFQTLHAAPALHAAPLAYASPSIGASHQSVLRSLGGNQAVSHYSKAVDSAFSSVRKYDTRITNDALAVAPVATYAHAAPAIATSYATHAAPLGLAHAGHLGYAAPLGYAAHAAPLGYAAHAAPIGYAAHAAPLATYAAHAPVIAKTAHVGAVAYSPAAVVSHATFTGLGAHYAW